jgi:peptide methionine sulfoxide reductase MsrB
MQMGQNSSTKEAPSCDISGCKPNAKSVLQQNGYPLIGDESIMLQKANGTCAKAPMDALLFGVSRETTNKICCFNRHYAEHSGYFLQTDWLKTLDRSGVTTYHDPINGKPLFKAPIGRSFDDFLHESKNHGWPSFRDEEVIWENVRVLRDGETVSVDGSHLGHNIPDRKGNRYCINLVSISGSPAMS